MLAVLRKCSERGHQRVLDAVGRRDVGRDASASMVDATCADRPANIQLHLLYVRKLHSAPCRHDGQPGLAIISIVRDSLPCFKAPGTFW